jgi:hypothetical protein
MRILKKRNLLQSIYDPQNKSNYLSNTLFKKKMKNSNEKENYFNPIIYKKNNLSNLDENIDMKPVNNETNFRNYIINEKRDKTELYNKINEILITNALKSEETLSYLFKEFNPRKIEYLEDKSRMQIDLE